MKIDLHCHSKYSDRPALWLMKRLGCPESFTEPLELYHLLKQRGMGAVTITDHNVIDGCLELMHLPDTFLGCEYTTYFPDDGCKVHVTAWNFTERDHAELSRLRENIFAFTAYLNAAGIPHSCAHPFFGPNGRLTPRHVELLILLYKHWELNGDQNPYMNRALEQVMAGLSPERVEQLSQRHQCAPWGAAPWHKFLSAGSDDHSSLNLARTHTEVPGAENLEDFWRGFREGRTVAHVRNATPDSFARNVYGIAYQCYKTRFGLERHSDKNLLLKFLDNTLHTRPDCNASWRSWFFLMLSRRRRPAEYLPGKHSLFEMARIEAENLIRRDQRLLQLVGEGVSRRDDLDERWFLMINELTNKLLLQLGQRLLEGLSKGRIFDLFNSLGSGAALYTLAAPYIASYAFYASERRISDVMLRHFGQGPAETPGARIAHFTDTFFEVNGVAKTLQQQLRLAREGGKDYHVFACGETMADPPEGLALFAPIGAIALPEYEELRLLAPSFLEVLCHCHAAEFTHIHIATPGPMGLAGLAIARILQLPVAATYHTAFPQFARALTDDAYVEDTAWKLMMSFYEQMDAIYAPSRATCAELLQRGLNARKLRIYPRGVDTGRFHPRLRSDYIARTFGEEDGHFNLLYAGRVSREKNLPLLVSAYERLLASGHPVRLLVAGDGPYRPEMERALSYTPAHFTGYLESGALAELYASCDALIFPSTTDTFGNAVLEALASGIPAIVSDTGGPQENVAHGKTGLVVQSDDRDALVSAVLWLLEDRARCQALGRAGREAMEKRSFANAFDTLWELYTAEKSPEESLRDAQAAPVMDLMDAMRQAANS
ncbi:MAG: glycosyltransferase [Candidatus Hydrogenedentes bacterium]|nr:glycosyltransferase [Candidatus Hydrogenedentota bacterium]